MGLGYKQPNVALWLSQTALLAKGRLFSDPASGRTQRAPETVNDPSALRTSTIGEILCSQE